MSPTIKFFLAFDSEIAKDYYFHDCVGLAEGFKELNISFGGNVNYWQEKDTADFLIKKVSDHFNAEVNIFSTYYFDQNPDDILAIDPNKYNVLIDSTDGVGLSCYFPKFKGMNLILRSHYHKIQSYPEKVRPWAFGLTNRIIGELKKTESLKPEERVFSNFRCDHNIRRIAVAKMNPILGQKYYIYEKISKEVDSKDKLSNKQTKGKHHFDYFERLNSSLLTYCFGGNYQLKIPFDKDFSSTLLRKYCQFKDNFLKLICKTQTYDEYLDFIHNHIFNYYINQFDSWRLWEALVSNSVPIHLDFEECGFVLPVMPENFKHYWGVTNMDYEQSATSLLATDKNSLKTIALEGKNWALTHYSPIAQAKRFLSYL